MYSKVASADEFLRGQRDCREGRPHMDGQHPDYDRGWSAQYQLEQVMDWASLNQEARNAR